MAKRPKSRKTTRRSTRTKRTRKATTRRAAAEILGPRSSLPLRQLQAELALAVDKLRQRAVPDREAISSFMRWSEEITAMCGRGACGPTMDPLD